MTTVDGISSKINEKIGVVNDLIRLVKPMIPALDLKNYERVIEGFEFGSLQILSDYYFLTDNSAETRKRKSEILSAYVRFIIQENVLLQLNHMFTFLKALFQKSGLRNNQTMRLFSRFEDAKITLVLQESRGYRCDTCNEQMSFIARDSVLECPKCFGQQDAQGMMFSEDQNDISEKNYKSNQYQTRKHGKNWIECLQGLESKEIPDNIVAHVRDCMRSERIIDLSKVTCAKIRGYLSRKTSMSKYNQHIPKIRKLVTGIEPPQLTEAESELFFEYYGKVINIYGKIKKKTNCPYCPYFIYKILEQILKGPEHTARRNRFFSYIHLQLSDTLNDQDDLWQAICAQIPEFTYSPTVRRVHS